MSVYNYMEMARVTGVPFSYLLSRGQQIKAGFVAFHHLGMRNLLTLHTKTYTYTHTHKQHTHKQHTHTHKQQVVSQLMRKSREQDLVIPVSDSQGSDEQYEGATVIEPSKGG